MTITMIAACGLNREIGKDNQLLWKLKSDLEYFKKKTTAQNIVLGRSTYESLGKPLPNRKNIVLTRNKDLEVDEGVIVHSSVSDILSSYKNVTVCGGEQIYKLFLPFTDRIYLTIVEATFPEADTFFPPLPQEWKCVSKYQRLKDKDNEFDHWYCTYEKVT